MYLHCCWAVSEPATAMMVSLCVLAIRLVPAVRSPAAAAASVVIPVGTPAMQWFKRAKPSCNPVEVANYMSRYPPPEGSAQLPSSGKRIFRNAAKARLPASGNVPVYCCVVIDAWSRRIVGWAIDSRQRADLAANELGMAIAPGIALVGFFLGQRPVPPNLFQMLGVGGAFSVPYAAARIAAYRSGMARSARRESVLPFVHWFELLRTNPAAANQFLATYLSQRDGERSALLADITAACAALEQTRPADPLLSTALNRLRGEIARLELTRGRHQSGRAV